MLAGAAERERIVASMVDVCLARGYGGMTLAEVLERAGMGERDFHRHFEDLEDCYYQVLEQMRTEFLLEVDASVPLEASWREQLRVAATAMFRFFVADKRRARIMLVEVYAAPPRAQLIRDQGMDAMIELIDRGRLEPGAPATLTRATAESIAGTAFNQMHAGLRRDDREEFDHIFSRLMYTAVLPYLGTEAALEELAMPPPEVE